MATSLDRANAMVSTVSGMDKIFMLIQYSSQLAGFLLLKSAHLKPTSRRAELARRLRLIASLLGDSRMLWRFFGLLPIFQWLRFLNSPAAKSRPSLLNSLERFQAYTMLGYYPLEHWYYLASKTIIRSSPATMAVAGMYSCRFWAAYVFVELYKKFLEFGALKKQLASKDIGKTEEKALKLQGEELSTSVFVNLAYAPLTLHWSLPNGLFASDPWVGVFGTLAAIGQVRSGWWSTKA